MSTSREIKINHINSIVIGAGPSGLATAYCLKQNNISYTILEASNRVANSWYYVWEDFELAQPVKEISMVGLNLEGFKSDYHLKRNEIIDTFTTYAAFHQLQIQYETTVSSIKKNDHHTYIIETNAATYHAQNVILGVGARQQPLYPPCISETFKATFKDKMLHSAWFQGQYNFPDSAHILIIGSGLSALSVAKNTKLANVTYRVTIACGYNDEQIAKNNKHLKTIPVTLSDLNNLGVDNVGRLTDLDYVTNKFIFNQHPTPLSVDQYHKIIFATGYAFAYDKICSLLNITNDDVVNHDCGVTKEPGLYLAGIPLKGDRTVTINQGSLEAENIVKHICETKRNTSALQQFSMLKNEVRIEQYQSNINIFSKQAKL